MDFLYCYSFKPYDGTSVTRYSFIIDVEMWSKIRNHVDKTYTIESLFFLNLKQKLNNRRYQHELPFFISYIGVLATCIYSLDICKNSILEQQFLSPFHINLLSLRVPFNTTPRIKGAIELHRMIFVARSAGKCRGLYDHWTFLPITWFFSQNSMLHHFIQVASLELLP